MSLEWLRVDSGGNVSLTTLNADEGTLVVDKVNDRVGVGNANPQTTLHVGDARSLTGTYERNGNIITINTSPSTHNYLLNTAIKLFFEGGDAIDGIYIINNVINAFSFTCIASAPTTGSSIGAVTVKSTIFFIEPATYTGKDNILTVVFPGHGFRIGDIVALFILSGDALSKIYQITGVSGDGVLFTVTHDPAFIEDTAGTVRLSAPLSTTPKETANGAIIYSSANARPSPAGSDEYFGTLWVSSTAEYERNGGASVCLGGLNRESSHTTFARIGGVQSKTSDLLRGDFTVETLYEEDGFVNLYERMRITSEGKVGVGTDAPRAKLDVYDGDIIVDGIFNSGFEVVENDVWDIQGNTDFSTHITSKNASTALIPEPSRLEDTDFSVRLVSEDRGYGVRTNKIVSNLNTADNFVYTYVAGICTGGTPIQFIPNKLPVTAVTPFTPSPPPNTLVGSSGFIAKVREDGTQIWASYQDSQGTATTRDDIDDNTTSLCVLNRGGNPQIACGGFSVEGEVFFKQPDGTNILSTTLGAPGYYVAVHDDAGVPVAVTSIFGAGATPGPRALSLSSSINSSFYAVGKTNSNGTLVVNGVNYTVPSTVILFIVKYSFDQSTNALSVQWVTYVEGSPGLYEESFGFTAMGSDNHLYVTGQYGGSPVLFRDQGDATVRAELTLQGGTGAFVAKYSDGGIFQWVSKMDGLSDETPTSLALDQNNNVYVTGKYKNDGINQGIEFFEYTGPTTQTKKLTLNPPSLDFAAYICKYTSAGEFVWATVVEGEGTGEETFPNREEALNVMVDSDNGLIVSVLVRSNTVNIYNQNNSDISEPLKLFKSSFFSSFTGGLILKYNTDGKCIYLQKLEGDNLIYPVGGCVSEKDQVYITGYTESDTYRFENPDGSTFSTYTDRRSFTSSDSFVTKLPYYPSFILQNLPGNQNFRKRLINPTPVTSYVTFFDPISNQTYEFTYVVPNGALDIQLFSNRWIRVTNVFRGVFTVDESSGYVGIGTQEPSTKFEVNGDMRVVGNVDVKSSVYGRNFIVTSDRRLKRNIRRVENAVEKIKSITPVEYEFIDNPDRRVVGVIAQDIEGGSLAHTIKRTRGFIPDVYTFCRFDEGLLRIPKARDGFLRILVGGVFKDVRVTRREEDVVEVTEDAQLPDTVFVYGYETDDLRTVDMQSLFALNMAATQELITRVSRVESRTKHLVDKLREVLKKH